jgi:transglutaminase-like putative cysteine protease
VDYRYGWLAGAAAISLAIFRLERLIRPAESGPPWMVALAAAAVLGLVITWTAIGYRVGPAGIVGANLLALALSAVRIAAPDTATFGVLPTLSTFEALRDELGFAIEVIRYGSAPVVPLAGLIAIMAAVFWVLGAALAWGLMRNKPAIALVPPILFYLQLATIDRVRPGLAWMVAALVIVGASLLAIGLDERRAAVGRLKRAADSSDVRPTPRALGTALLALPVAIGVFAMGVLGGWVDESGFVNWRRGTSIGGGIASGVSYNLFAGIIQQGLVANSDTELFRVRVSGDVDPRQLYFRLINLEQYDGQFWRPAPASIRRPTEGEPWGDPQHRQAGSVSRLVQEVTIASLRQNYLPVLAQPRDLVSPFRVLQDSFRVREDGSIKIDLLTFDGLTYTVVSDYAVPDYGALATTPSGELSPIFAQASEDGVFGERPAARSRVPAPENLTDFLQLPDELDERIAQEARFITASATTPFERGTLLEAYYQNTTKGDRAFTYSTETEGHGAQDLAAWLFDPLSPNYRRGYCEQFATGMAVMARTLGIPSRVVLGFAPGDVDGDTMYVRRGYAHAWVEAWIDGHGWVRFDPTPRSDGRNSATYTAAGAAFNPIDYLPETSAAEARTDLAIDFPTAEERDPTLSPDASSDAFQWLVVRLLALAVVLLVGVATVPTFKLIRRRRRLARLRTGDITAAWEEIIDRLTDLGTPVSDHQTPFEVADSTNPTMEPLAREYARLVYGPEPTPTRAAIATAQRSFHQTEDHLNQTHPRGQRIWSWLRLRSVRSSKL